MLWYGFFYYIFYLFSIIFFIYFLFKNLYINSLIRHFNYNFLIKNLLSFFLVYLILILFSIYMIFEFYTNLNNFYFYNNFFFYESFFIESKLYNLNLLHIYYFPFIYIFILITILSLFFCLVYNINELLSFIFYCTIILLFGYMLFFTNSLILFFISYEMLLIPSFFILYKYAKTRRCIEAAYLMFFWTQFGALFLIFSFIYLFFISKTSLFENFNYINFSIFEINFLFFCWIIGFGVKLPIWPFYGWLPKAHVEASTNFSIFLSGVLVKFAFFGLLKCILSVNLENTFIFFYPFLIIGITDSVFKLFYQIDLKKLVAYSTVVEMHWLTICVISGYSPLFLSGFCMLISHALLSSNSFLIVDAINRRFKTRLITEINGINFLTPKLFLIALINCLIFLGFPGTIFFIAEFLFFSFLFDLFPLLCFFLIILLYFFAPTFFFRTWINVMFGLAKSIYKTIPLDLDNRELIVFSFLIILMFWLGVSWQSFFF